MIYQIDYHAFCAYMNPGRLLRGCEITKGSISETNCTQDYLKRSRSNPWFKDKDPDPKAVKNISDRFNPKSIVCPITDFVAAIPPWYSGSGRIGKVVADRPFSKRELEIQWPPNLYSNFNFHTREPKDIYWLDEDGLIKEISKQFAKNIDKIYLMGPTPESSAVITGIGDPLLFSSNEVTFNVNLDKMMKEMKGEMTKGERDVIHQNLTEIERDIRALISSNEQYEKANYQLRDELGKLKVDNSSLTGSRDYWKQRYENASARVACNHTDKTPEDPFATNRQNNPFWVDREGVKQHIQSLDDKHLINIFNVLNNEARYGEHPPKMKYVLNEFKRRGISVQRG